jgi:DNA recombination protein RmuC
MDLPLALLLLAGGMAAAGLVVWLFHSRALAVERDRAQRAEAAGARLVEELQAERVSRAAAEAAAARIAGLEAELAGAREALSRAAAQNAQLAAERDAVVRDCDRRMADLTALRGEIETRMRALAADALRGSQESFLALAGQVFERHHQTAAAMLEQKQQAIAGLVNPVAVALDAYQKGLSGFEKAHAVLASEVQRVGAQAHKLATALQASPKVRGRWGEQQLQNVIELAGLTDHVDFLLQRTVEAEDGKQRPDLVIRLPGERLLVVDAKAPLTAYFDANEAADEDAREAHLRRHAQQVRTHLRQLGSKRYWEALRPLTPEFVIMFIPGENFYRAAFERDPDLLEDGWKDRVLVASPTTLVGLAMTVGFGWQREAAAENARHVGELGRELYKRLATMGSHVARLGNSLRQTVDHYGSFVGSLEASVMPQARRFRDLKVEGTQAALPVLKPLEVLPRELHSGSDLVISEAEVIPSPPGERATGIE